MKKVHKDRLRALCDELESGTYAQTRYTLKDHRGYCCLGVACEVYRKQTGNGYWRSVAEDNYFVVNPNNEEISVLPPTVQTFFGLDSPDMEFPTKNFKSALQMNDRGTSFKEIAATIRQVYEL